MPNYNAGLATRSMWRGAGGVMADSTLVTPFTTNAYLISPDPSAVPPSITVDNPSSEAVVVQSSAVDRDAQYATLSTVAAGTSALISIPEGLYFRLSMAAAPSAGVTVTRSA
jgi:hypothetical protein